MAAAAKHAAQEPQRHLTPRDVLLRLMLAVGVCFMLYPAFNRLVFMWSSMNISNSYERTVAEQPSEEALRAWERACAYNAAHRDNVVFDPFSQDGNAWQEADEYAQLLNPMGDGVMGFVDIPAIGQRLNIYHGTNDAVLERGVGHMVGTSLPVGGEGTHCVLSGHRGLASAKLLTDLDRLDAGDMVYLHVLGQVLAYEVDGQEVVLPNKIDVLNIVPGQDLLTLLTCTPYAVNSHRLLVRAHRVPYVPEEDHGARAAGLSFAAQCAIVVAIVVVALVVGRLGGRWLMSRDVRKPTGKHVTTRRKSR